MSHADDTTLPCEQCGGDKETGHQRLCAVDTHVSQPEDADELPAEETRSSDPERPSLSVHKLQVEIKPYKPTRQNKYTITFYSSHSQPKGLPPFSYAVVGSVLGNTKFQAFLTAPSPADAAYAVSDYFLVVDVETVQAGYAGIAEAPLRGTIVPDEPTTVFGRIARWLFGHG